jgi:EmrB/QacA subfamily drug resistance transporter
MAAQNPAVSVERGSGLSGGGYLSGIAGVLVLLGVFLAILMGGMDALVVNTALPAIGKSFGQTNGLTLVVAVYLISSTVSIPIFAKLSDRYSRRNVFLAGLAVFIAGSALAGLSQSLGQLIVFRGVQGFGTGGFIPVGIAMVSVLFPPKQRARLTGILSAAGGLSIVLGPILGSYIVDVTTWRWVFYVNLPIGIASAIVLLIALGPLTPDERGHVDYVGAGLLAGWVTALMFPLVEVTEDGWTWLALPTVALLAVAVIGFVGFLTWELRQADPLVPLRLLGRRVLAASGTVSLFNGVILTAALTLLSVFVGVVLLHEGPNSANDIRDLTYFFAIPMILGAALGGQLLSRFSYRAVIVPSLALASGATLVLTTFSETTPLWALSFGFLPTGGIVLPLIPMGFGLGVPLAGVLIVTQNEASRAEMGAAIGLMRFLQSLGGAVGLSLLTAYQQWFAGSPSNPPGAVVASYDAVFLVMATLVGVALFASFFLNARATPRPPPSITEPSVPTNDWVATDSGGAK